LFNVFERLKQARLRRLAPSLYAPRPLGYYPGWRFGIDEEGEIGALTLKRRVVWEYCNRKRWQLPLTVAWYDGLQLRLHLGDDLSRCQYVGGCYEPNEFAFLAETLEPGMTFVDIGANDGWYTLFAARRVGSAGSVLAFEPSAREYARLLDNLQLNRLANVRPHAIALAAEPSTGTLRIGDFEHAGQNTLGQFIYDGVHCAALEKIPLERLDDVLEREGGAAPDVIKMDVEGAEFAVLQGARRLLEARRPLLLLELSDAALRQQGSSAAEVLTLLRGLGYVIFTFSPVTGRPVRATSDAELSPNVVAAHPARSWRTLNG
jgi:FkbM family methyltransferase